MAHITSEMAPFNALARLQAAPHSSSPKKNKHLKPSVGASLPFDILVLILEQLKGIYLEVQDPDAAFGHRGGRFAWHQSLKTLATVSAACAFPFLVSLHAFCLVTALNPA
jgi:hypothetical protein